MTRIVEVLASWLAQLISPLCSYRYSFARDAGAIVALGAWRDRVTLKWQHHGLPGPIDAPGWDRNGPLTAMDYAWMLGYDQALVVDEHGCSPDAQTAAVWAAIQIDQPWHQRAGLAIMQWFTYGTDCQCCHGYRVLLLALTAGATGYLLG